jgi:tetratricopeptide (TPR) repeat protein
MDVAVAQNTTWKDCELADRDPERSIAACSRVLARGSGPARAGAFHNRGLAYAAKGNLDQAISDISAGIRLDPQRAYRWQERGEIYARQGKYQQAIADISEAIRIDPTPRTFRFHNRAQAYRGTGDLTRAIADFDEAIRLDPVPRSFRFYDRANALRDAGQYIRALADYESVLRLEPTNAWAFVDRGRTYVRMGRSQAAKSDFDTALKLDQPPNEELRRAVEVELAAISTPSTAAPPPAAVVPIPSPPRTAAPASPQDTAYK